jgi:hypothetical protein
LCFCDNTESNVVWILRGNGKKKKQKGNSKEPAIPEGTEEGDESDVSVESSSEGTDTLSSNASYTNGHTEEQMIAKALEECLGLAGDDPDIAEATRRLLASKILSPEMFECEEDDNMDSAMGRYLGNASESGDESFADSDEEEDKKEEGDEESGGYKDMGCASERGDESFADSDEEEDKKEEGDEESGCDEETPYDPHRGIYSNKSFHEHDMPTESTGLLSPAQELRPSIFTTVASLAEIEGESDKNEKGERSDANEKSP